MKLHIVEPTLNSFAGHCHSLVEALAAGTQQVNVEIWAGRESQAYWSGPGQLRPYFYRSMRRVQAMYLYRKLLKGEGKILVATAGTSDFLTLGWVAGETIPPGKCYLYVHWLGAKSHKADRLRQLARRQPHLEVLATTDSVAAFFKDLGFRARAVPYPMARPQIPLNSVAEFRRLVVAGAARMDKGFNHIVDLVEMLKKDGASLPIVVQASATHRDRHPPDVAQQIARLQSLGYAHLELLTQTLTPQAYPALFPGGISVQPYSSQDFQDRVSGVTLDALGAGCPVVVTAGTWLARTVEAHRAGVAFSELSAVGLKTAIDEILLDYHGFASRAASAGQILQSRHSATAMMDVLLEPPG